MFHATSVLSGLPEELNEVAPSANGDTGLFATNAAESSMILKYEDPVLASPHAGFDMGMGHDSLPQYVSLYASNERHVSSALRLPGGGGGLWSKRRPHAKEDNTAILKAIIPNKEWADEAGGWVQTVSSTERTRAELELLQGKVDARLAALQARPIAICAVREQVFSELYDEIIREVTIRSPERGLLLLRLRDESRMNLDTYAEIYRDSVSFSRRKAEGAREELSGTQSLVEELEAQTSNLRAQVRSLEARLASINRSNAYAKTTADQEHAETLQMARAEQRALEAAIAKSQKKLKEAAIAAAGN